MAAIDTTRPAYLATGFIGRAATLVSRAIAAIAGWNDIRVTRNALSRLSDRELEDIGLVRGDIDTVASRSHLF